MSTTADPPLPVQHRIEQAMDAVVDTMRDRVMAEAPGGWLTDLDLDVVALNHSAGSADDLATIVAALYAWAGFRPEASAVSISTRRNRWDVNVGMAILLVAGIVGTLLCGAGLVYVFDTVGRWL